MFQGCGSHHVWGALDSENSSGSERERVSQSTSLDEHVQQRVTSNGGGDAHHVWGNIDVDNSMSRAERLQDFVQRQHMGAEAHQVWGNIDKDSSSSSGNVLGDVVFNQDSSQSVVSSNNTADGGLRVSGTGMIQQQPEEEAPEDGAAPSAKDLHESGHPSGGKRSRARPCKSTRLQCKQVAAMVDAIADRNERQTIVERLSSQSKYMKSVLDKKMQEQDASDAALRVAAAVAPKAKARQRPQQILNL